MSSQNGLSPVRDDTVEHNYDAGERQRVLNGLMSIFQNVDEPGSVRVAAGKTFLQFQTDVETHKGNSQAAKVLEQILGE